jgi:tryptophan synthase alpha chain
MNPIDALFHRLRQQRRKAFIPFLAAGDPDLETTELFLDSLFKSGAHLVEIGFPYSDPIADGPIIQASYTRALEHGIRVDDIFTAVRRFVEGSDHAGAGVAPPLVGMVSYSIVHRRGPELFLKQARDAGFSGAIIPDLPIDEAETISRLAAARDFKLIHLVTPTTPPDRAVRIAQLSTGFLYCVSTTGITGERDRLPDALVDQLAWLRKQTELPLCVGFGISKPEHVTLLRDVVDGVIVGSAFVRRIEQTATKPLVQVVDGVTDLAHSLIAALNPPAV